MYKQLDPQKIVETVAQLRRRIAERFPDASLGRVVAELEDQARDARERSRWIRRPVWLLRGLSALVILTTPALLWFLEVNMVRDVGVTNLADFVQTLEAFAGSVVFLGAGLLFVATLEGRLKRARVLVVIHELRAMAHIVDMHQLTKDPESLVVRDRTPSSPDRQLTPFLLGRYFDYCSEALSLISKVAAIYVQGFSDPVVLSAVDEVESLCTGLARKIWQKIMVLDQVGDRAERVGLAGNAPGLAEG